MWCAFLDMTDGMIARATGKSSRFGAFLDSTLDRFADAAVFGGIAWGMLDYHRLTALAALLCLAFGSFVPYARARAEGLGIDTKTGIADTGGSARHRPNRGGDRGARGSRSRSSPTRSSSSPPRLSSPWSSADGTSGRRTG